MKVENVYQDNEGNWHIDYGLDHLMGLAIRVYFGHCLISLFVAVPVMIFAALTGFAFNESLPKENTCSPSIVEQKHIDAKLKSY